MSQDMSHVMSHVMSTRRNGVQLVVRHLEAQGVDYVFAIPGAKIDPVEQAQRDGDDLSVTPFGGRQVLEKGR